MRKTPSIFSSAVTWLGLASTLACYILLVNSPGTSDVTDFWLAWIGLIGSHGVSRGYALAASDYLPGTFACLAAIRAIGDAAGLSIFLALKIAIILAAWTGALVYWAWSRNLPHTVALLVALMIGSAAHGYLDVLFLSPLLLMLWALHGGRFFTAGLFLGLALSIKWQPLLVAPFVLVYVLERRSWSLVGLLSAGAALPLTIQLAMVGAQPLVASFTHAASHRALSYQGLNINWVSQMALYKARGYTGAYFDIKAPRLLAQVMKGCFYLAYAATLVAWWIRQRGRQDRDDDRHDAVADLLWCAFTGSLAYFVLNTGVHENHLFVTMVLAFCLLTIGAPRAGLACVFCAVSLNVNLILFYGLQGRTPVDPAFALPASIAVSLINTAFFGFCFYEALRGPRRTAKTSLAVAG